MSARERMLGILKEHGWTQDESRTYRVGYRRSYRGPDNREVRVHPGHWVKPAIDGGTWKLYLNYEVPGSYSTRFDNRLRDAQLTYQPADPEAKKRYWRLSTPTRSRYYQPLPEPLYAVLGGGNETASLRERVELLVRNPELAVWLAMEEQHTRKLEAEKRVEQMRRDREERARPLPITVEHDPETASWKSTPWRELTNRAERAAKAVAGADGKSDLYALVDELEAATAAIREVLKVRVDA